MSQATDDTGNGPWNGFPADSFLTRARIALENNNFSEARRSFQAAAALDAQDGSALFGLGSTALFLGQWEAAERWFGMAEKSDPRFRVTGDFLASDMNQLIGKPLDLPALHMPQPPDSGQPLVFVACDEAYCHYFALPLALSLDAAGGPWGMHLHLVDPGPDSLTMVSALSDAAPSLALTLSWEFADHRSMPTETGKAYLASARFLRLPALLDRMGSNGAPLLILDADAIVNRDPWPQIHSTCKTLSSESHPDTGSGSGSGWDWALHYTGYRGHGPLMLTWAACVGIAPTDPARAMAGHLAALLHRAFQSGHGRWMIDQFALYCAATAGPSLCPGFTLSHWPETVFVPDRSDPEMAVWSFGAARKKTDPAFRAAATHWFGKLHPDTSPQS